MKSSIPWNNNEKPIEFPSRVLGATKISPNELSQHVFLAGAPGTGKTSTGINPILIGYWNYLSNDGLKVSMLVVDPKVELINTLRKLDARDTNNRLIELMNEDSIFNLNPFEGLDMYPGLDDKMEYLFNQFDGNKAFDGNNGVFRDSSLALLHEMSCLEEAYFKTTGQSLFTSLAMLCSDTIKNPNFADGLHILSKHGARAVLYPVKRIHWAAVNVIAHKDISDEVCVFDLIEILIKQNAPNLIELFAPLEVYQRESLSNPSRTKENLKQFGYYVSYWELLLNTLRSSRYKKMFNLNSILGYNGKKVGPIAEWINNEKVLLVTPQIGVVQDEMIVKTLKRLVFNAMLERENMLAPMAYIADEFQNFISTDESSGEHNFLDRCRSFRVSCVLATQSVDSLSERVTRQNGAAGAQALSSMLNNISNRMIFRTSDFQTTHLMRIWIEVSPIPHKGHVIDKTPLASLNVGECYWMRGGNWSREQVELAPSNDIEHSLQAHSQPILHMA